MRSRAPEVPVQRFPPSLKLRRAGRVQRFRAECWGLRTERIKLATDLIVERF
jgi:hypothetical protein